MPASASHYKFQSRCEHSPVTWALVASKTKARSAAAATIRPGLWSARTWGHNTLWVVQGHEHPWLQSRSLSADQAS